MRAEPLLRGGRCGGGAPPQDSWGPPENWKLALGDLPALAIPRERVLRPWLAPLASLWKLGASLRAHLPAPEVGVPVVAIGGLAAGGTGKTPLAAWMAEALAGHGPLVVGRGYRRRAGEDVRLVGPAADLGDELCMLARRGLRVVSAPDRRLGILTALQAAPAGVAILDDGLGTRSVRADLRVLTIDSRWPLAGGGIPAGDRRLPMGEIPRADVCVILHGSLPEGVSARLRPDALRARAELRAARWLHRGARLPLEALCDSEVSVVSGIARPAGFLRMLRGLGMRLRRVTLLEDHAPETAARVAEALAEGLPVVMTEKDAARLPEGAPVWALVVELVFLEGEAALRDRLTRLIRAPEARA